jgi:hypothetical protein
MNFGFRKDSGFPVQNVAVFIETQQCSSGMTALGWRV